MEGEVEVDKTKIKSFYCRNEYVFSGNFNPLTSCLHCVQDFVPFDTFTQNMQEWGNLHQFCAA